MFHEKLKIPGRNEEYTVRDEYTDYLAKIINSSSSHKEVREKIGYLNGIRHHIGSFVEQYGRENVVTAHRAYYNLHILYPESPENSLHKPITSMLDALTYVSELKELIEHHKQCRDEGIIFDDFLTDSPAMPKNIISAIIEDTEHEAMPANKGLSQQK